MNRPLLLHSITPGLVTLVALFAALTLSLTETNAQNNDTQSPFTRFGIGTPSKPSTHATKGMGSLGLAVRDASLINPMNPASYTAADSLTFIFDFGFHTSLSVLEEGNDRFAGMQGNISYISLLFPFNKYAAFSAGLKPFSSVGYTYAVSAPVENAPQSTYTSSYNGSGNINSVYAGLSVQPVEAWSVGINGEFLFGTITHNRVVAFDETLTDAYNPAFNDRLQLRGWSLTAGTQAQIPLKDDNALIIGATYTPRLPFSSVAMRHNTISRSGVPATTILADTVRSRSSFYTPDTYGLGIGWKQGDRLYLGADFYYNRWGKAFTDTAGAYNGADQWQVALGMSLTPDARSSAYGRKIQYRWGLTAQSPSLKIRNQEGGYDGLYRAGVSLGLGLPLVDRRSYVDVALSYNRDIPTGALKVADNYLELSLSLRFNEAWFKKIRLE